MFSESTGQGDAGNISLQAKNSIILNSSFIRSVSSGENNIANGGNINIMTGLLSLTDQSQINTGIDGNSGESGNILISASNDVLLNKNSVINSSNFGVGKAGTISISADGNVSLFRSSLFAASGGGLIADDASIKNNGSDIKIESGNFILSDTSILLTSAFGNSNAGNVFINSNNDIIVNTGSSISTQVFGSGNAGNVDINANNTVIIDGSLNGVTPRFTARNGFSPTAFPSEITTEVVPLPTSPSIPGRKGQSGNINVNSRNLLITNNAKLSSSSEGLSNAGNINIKSYNAKLDNGGQITATNDSEDGGNINLAAQDLLLLRRNSVITTNAGTAQAGGDGGNINIDAPFIIALPSENSDITANAFSGKGGNVNIRAQSIFGISTRSNPSPATSDITASSEFGVQGQILIQQPEAQPQQSIIELPEEVVDATQQVAEICPKEPGTKMNGEFFITGRGSLPPSPLDMMPGTSTQRSLASQPTPASTIRENHSNQPTISNIPPSPPQIIEAQSWVKTADGSIALVAVAPHGATNTKYVSCHGKLQ